MGAFRHFLACSRPLHHQHSRRESKEGFKEQSSDAPSSIDLHLASLAVRDTDRLQLHAPDGRPDADRQTVVELHAVLRHLQVRWQLFNESLSKFHDPEAMLANCTDDVTWSTADGDIIKGKSHELLALLQSLCTRKLSLEVEIQRISRVTPSGALDVTLDKSGSCGWLVGSELCTATSALSLVLPSPGETSYLTSEGRPLMILEKDTYTLRNAEGSTVEKGKRTILWEQHNATWYIRGFLSYPVDG